MSRSPPGARMRIGLLLCLILPMALAAQVNDTQTRLGADALLQECRTRQQNQPWADCACYTRKVMELRAARPGGNETLFQTEAWYACPDPAAIEATENRICLDQRKLRVPPGLDATAWCQCRAKEITRLTMAHAPAKHEVHTQPNIWNRAEAHCKRTVTTADDTPVHGLDLSGPWRFQSGILDLHFEGAPGKWSQAPHESGGEVRHFQHAVTVVGFSEHMASASASMHQHPVTRALDLRIGVQTRIPYLRAARCTATDVTTSRISGRCMDATLNDAGPFTMRRPGPGETVTTLTTVAQATVPQTSVSQPPVNQAPANTAATPASGSEPAQNPAACPSGRDACYAVCASQLTRLSLDMRQRLAQCRQACKASCPQ